MNWWQWQKDLNSIKRDVVWIIIVAGAEEESHGDMYGRANLLSI